MRRSRHNFRRSKPMQAISEINVTSLLDLCFCLLIIFMISTPLIDANASSGTQTLPLDLPSAQGSDTTSNDLAQAQAPTISMDSVGRISWMDKELSGTDELEKILKKESSMRPARTIRIRIDKNNPYQDAITILNLLQKYNLTQISFDYQSE